MDIWPNPKFTALRQIKFALDAIEELHHLNPDNLEIITTYSAKLAYPGITGNEYQAILNKIQSKGIATFVEHSSGLSWGRNQLIISDIKWHEFDTYKTEIENELEEKSSTQKRNRTIVAPKTLSDNVLKIGLLTKDIPLWLKYVVAVITVLSLVWAVYAHYYPNNNSTFSNGQTKDVNNDPYINYGQNHTDKSNKIRQKFEGDVYELPNKAEHLHTTREKNNYFKKYTGLWVESIGYITDIYEPGFNQVGDKNGIFFQVRIDDINKKTSPYIMCFFDETWSQKLDTINIPFKTKFHGVIDSVQPNTRVWLIDCELQ
ncbi:MAG: hypothetical protein AB7I96_11945 [Candidatus Dadabacteria bacterium]